MTQAYRAVEVRKNWWAVVDANDALILGALSQVTAHDLAERFETAYMAGRAAERGAGEVLVRMSVSDAQQLTYLLGISYAADYEWLADMQERIQAALAEIAAETGR